MAEQLINPFGEDDDDFETNWLIDRNFQVLFTIYHIKSILMVFYCQETHTLLFVHTESFPMYCMYVCLKGVYDGGG